MTEKTGQNPIHDFARSADALLQRAEKTQRERCEKPEIVEELSPEAARRLIHDLQVHQIELEMQNEELRRMQVQLDVARERYFDLYELAPVGYFLLNIEGLILEANLTFAALLGAPKKYLVHQPLSRFIFPEDQSIYRLHQKLLLEAGSTPAYEIRLIKQDGSTFWVRLEANLAHSDDGTTMIRGMGSDVTELKLVQDELVELNSELEDRVRERTRQLEEANRRHEAASRAKSAFLSSMSHELRTPLNAVIGFAEVLQDQLFGPLNEKQEQYVADVLDSGKHLLSLINDVLDLSKVESGKMDLELGPVKLSRLCRETVSLFHERSRKQGVSLQCTVDAAADAEMIGDERRLTQVLLNLIDNAIKFNKPGGSVSVGLDCVYIAASAFWRIVVEDTGVGIAAEDLSKLFKPFTQLTRVHTKPADGTGLGLALTRHLVEMHGGEIHVESVLGKGSRFIVLIPMQGE